MARGKLLKRSCSICAYCGSADDLTDDHIPPKCLFARPRPNDLITVRACRHCVNDTSKDDEYFRQCLALSEQVGRNKAAAAARKAVLRSLTRYKSPGLRGALVRDFRRLRIQSPGGIELGSRLGFDVQLDRLFKTVARIVRGLYFRRTNMVLGQHADVRVFNDDALRSCPPDVLSNFRRTILVPLAATSRTVIAGGAFSFCVQESVDSRLASAWALVFFESVSFVALTAPRAESECSAQHRCTNA